MSGSDLRRCAPAHLGRRLDAAAQWADQPAPRPDPADPDRGHLHFISTSSSWLNLVEGEHYGRRHFMELVSVFTSDPVFKVLHESQELGSVDQITFLRHREEEPAVLSMGGRSWLVTLLDWERREAFVVPTESKGKSQWQGGRIGMSWRFARAVHSLLASKSESDRWTSRTRSALTSLREQYGFLRPEADVAVTDRERDEVEWFTFAGGLVNTALADAMNARGLVGVSLSDFWIRASGNTDARHIVGTVRSLQLGEIHNSFKIAKVL
ncbi:MAG TPA: hypothetical protein VIS71_01050, partial [Terrimicrobium sp.]